MSESASIAHEKCVVRQEPCASVETVHVSHVFFLMFLGCGVAVTEGNSPDLKPAVITTMCH